MRMCPNEARPRRRAAHIWNRPLQPECQPEAEHGEGSAQRGASERSVQERDAGDQATTARGIGLPASQVRHAEDHPREEAEAQRDRARRRNVSQPHRTHRQQGDGPEIADLGEVLLARDGGGRSDRRADGRTAMAAAGTCAVSAAAVVHRRGHGKDPSRPVPTGCSCAGHRTTIVARRAEPGANAGTVFCHDPTSEAGRGAETAHGHRREACRPEGIGSGRTASIELAVEASDRNMPPTEEGEQQRREDAKGRDRYAGEDRRRHDVRPDGREIDTRRGAAPSATSRAELLHRPRELAATASAIGSRRNSSGRTSHV